MTIKESSVYDGYHAWIEKLIREELGIKNIKQKERLGNREEHSPWLGVDHNIRIAKYK